VLRSLQGVGALFIWALRPWQQTAKQRDRFPEGESLRGHYRLEYVCSLCYFQTLGRRWRRKNSLMSSALRSRSCSLRNMSSFDTEEDWDALHASPVQDMERASGSFPLRARKSPDAGSGTGKYGLVRMCTQSGGNGRAALGLMLT